LFKNNSFFSKYIKGNQYFGEYFNRDPLLNEMDNAALIIRTNMSIFVVYVENKKLQIFTYSDFVANPKHSFIKIRMQDPITTAEDTLKIKRIENLKFFEKLQR
jgi:hypothetical protein